mmetsp:Transcript_34961/g.88289  ORF Transcript_34961/g.88289 Transcript_34961/m.88289 type:complete len:265 (+) Transcript_34961:638-1432(+)
MSISSRSIGPIAMCPCLDPTSMTRRWRGQPPPSRSSSRPLPTSSRRARSATGDSPTRHLLVSWPLCPSPWSLASPSPSRSRTATLSLLVSSSLASARFAPRPTQTWPSSPIPPSLRECCLASISCQPPRSQSSPKHPSRPPRRSMRATIPTAASTCFRVTASATRAPSPLRPSRSTRSLLPSMASALPSLLLGLFRAGRLCLRRASEPPLWSSLRRTSRLLGMTGSLRRCTMTWRRLPRGSPTLGVPPSPVAAKCHAPGDGTEW